MLLFAKKEEREKREKVCSSCEYRKDKRCSVCNCFIIGLTKIKFASCPKNKWELKNDK